MAGICFCLPQTCLIHKTALSKCLFYIMSIIIIIIFFIEKKENATVIYTALLLTNTVNMYCAICF